MLKTKVKAGPITNLTDARYFAARGVEWLSFDFDQNSETYLPPHMMRAIREWVDGVQFVGEFGITTPLEMRALIEECQLDTIQVGLFVEVDMLLELQSPVPVMKEIVIERHTSAAEVTKALEQFQPWVQFFVLDFAKNGFTWEMLQTDKNFSPAQLQEWCKRFPIILNIDFQKEMLNDFLDVLLPAGFCVKGGEEEKIGYKSFDELDEIFDLLELSEQF